MHKAVKRYEVDTVADDEEAKQWQFKLILNRLTPQNFQKLFKQVKEVNIDNVVTLSGVVSQIFEKALLEPNFCEMYANLCLHLAAALPDLSQDNEKITFKRLLLNKCQEEFERGEREQEEASKADECEVKMSNEEREEKRTNARRCMLGNIRLIGELYKKKMLTERIMHECIKKLLGQCQDPDEEYIEALCTLMSTIGGMIDHPKATEHMDAYFERMKLLSNNMNLSSGVRFMLKDLIDWRKNKWKQSRKVEGPKKIEEVHRDASQARLAQAGRLGRVPGKNPTRRIPMQVQLQDMSMAAIREDYRNPLSQTPLQYAENPDAKRWQHAASFQHRSLIRSPSTRTPLLMRHIAEMKYVADEEEAKQRWLQGILEKLTPQNFQKLFKQVKAVNIDNVVTLNGVVSQIFEKALLEPNFCEMYANLCLHLAAALPDLSQDNEKITFKRLLLNKCQEEFERGERKQEEASEAPECEVKMSNEEREEKRTNARRRMLGNIRLIGELYKKKMLTERIMHECIKKLLGQYQDPDEEDIEALCTLMSTIGGMIDHPKAMEHMDAYFERMKLLSNNVNLSSRVRFMLKDLIDLRKNKWQQSRIVEGPKKIEEVHRDASQERLAQTGRLGHGPSNNPPRRIPMDFGPRGSSILSSPNAQMGGLHGLLTQVRGYGSQEVRIDEMQAYEARTLSVPFRQIPLGDDSITLGPQGILARGMSIRVPLAVSSSTSPSGYGDLAERTPYSSGEDLASRYIPDIFTGSTAYDQSGVQESIMNYGNRDMRNAERIPERPVVTSPPALTQGTTVSQNTFGKGWSEERLQNMSMAAIKEYYSARDVNEVVLCIKDLNSPSFHPCVVSLWVRDSFERKDTERDLLAQLLVNLVKSQDGTLSQAHLIKGFESVLAALEDAVNDAPKAPEFLGRIFAKAITEHVVSLKEIGRLIHDGGEEPGSLLEDGLAADVLGSTLEVIKMEKGDAVLSEIRVSSNLRLETFRPPDPLTSRKLEKFI